MEAQPSAPFARQRRSPVHVAADIFLDPVKAFKCSEEINTAGYAGLLLFVLCALNVFEWPFKKAILGVDDQGPLLIGILSAVPVLFTLVMWLIYALILWGGTWLLGVRASFGQAFRVIVMAASVMVLGALVNAVALNIAFHSGFTPRALSDLPTLNSVLHLSGRAAAIAQLFGVFSIWFFALVGVASYAALGLSRRRAWAAAALIFAAAIVASLRV